MLWVLHILIMILLNAPKTLYAPDLAESIARELNEDNDWLFVVMHDPKGTGYSYIAVYDEDNKLVGTM